MWSPVRDLVGLDAGDDIGPIRVIVQHVILDLVVVLEAEIAVRALVDDDVVRHDSLVASKPGSEAEARVTGHRTTVGV